MLIVGGICPLCMATSVAAIPAAPERKPVLFSAAGVAALEATCRVPGEGLRSDSHIERRRNVVSPHIQNRLREPNRRTEGSLDGRERAGRDHDEF